MEKKTRGRGKTKTEKQQPVNEQPKEEQTQTVNETEETPDAKEPVEANPVEAKTDTSEDGSKEEKETTKDATTPKEETVKKNRDLQQVELFVKYLGDGVANKVPTDVLIGYQKVIIDTINKGYGITITKSDLVKLVKDNKWLTEPKGYATYLSWNISDEHQRKAYHSLFTLLKLVTDKTEAMPDRIRITEQFTGAYLELGDKLIKDFLK